MEREVSAVVDPPAEREAYPLAESRAASLLREGLARAKIERNVSARKIALGLGYKQPVVLSHMASGRVPVPLERAVEIAGAVGLPPSAFLLAALEQREPKATQLMRSPEAGRAESFVGELQALAGGSLEELPGEHKQVLREVVADRAPGRRWLSLPELRVVAELRTAAPHMGSAGLSPTELNGILAFLNA